MDNFISTFVFILPGLMAYFWLQAFGLNPPVKHTAQEITGISALLWLPISFTTLALLNSWAKLHGNFTEIFRVNAAWNVNEFKVVTSDLRYLFLFITLNVIVSYLLCAVWAKWGNEFKQKVINRTRKWRGLAELSDQPTVWEDLFHRDDLLVVEISKIDKQEERYIGTITKTSRPFETERAVVLQETKLWTSIIERHKPIPEKIYIDTKSGFAIKIFNVEEVLNYAREDLVDGSTLLWGMDRT